MTKKLVITSLIITIAMVMFMIGNATATKKITLQKSTADDLSTAMHGEAFAYAKYMLYAEHARKNGNEEVAKLFETAAKTERFEHFAEEAKLAGLVGTDAQNLKDAMTGESYEVETMYREFAEKATSAGDKIAAQRFQEVRADEMKHRDGFQEALAKLEKPSITKD